MNKERMGEVALVLIVVILIGGVLPATQNATQIPDHSSFKVCRPCHAEKNTMWEESKHAKRLRIQGISFRSSLFLLSYE
jgi:hypothetical protein